MQAHDVPSNKLWATNTLEKYKVTFSAARTISIERNDGRRSPGEVGVVICFVCIFLRLSPPLRPNIDRASIYVPFADRESHPGPAAGYSRLSVRQCLPLCFSSLTTCLRSRV